MQNSKLVQLLAGLDNTELKLFGKYIRNNYGNYQLAMSLFKYLKSCHPDTDSDKLKKEKVIKKVLGLENPEPQKLKNLLNQSSLLYKWLEDFLILQKLNKKGNTQRERLLTEIFRDRKLNKLFKLKLKSNIKAYENTPCHDIWDIINILYVQHMWYHYSDPSEGLHTEDQQTAKELIEKLDSFYLAAKLRYGCELINRKNILQEQHNIWLWNQIGPAIEVSYSKSMLHQSLFLASKLLESKKEKDYQNLEAYYLKHSTEYPPELKQVIHGYLINFAAEKIKQGEDIWTQKLFELYKHDDILYLLFKNGLVSSMRFLNIINVACSLEQLEWAKKFVKDWTSDLRVTLRVDTETVSKALIKFSEGSFEDVLEILRTQKSHDPFLEIRIRSLILMSMVELSEEEASISYCDTFKVYLYRSKVLNEQTIQGYSNFVKVTKMYVNDIVVPSFNINQYKPIANKKWLIKKLQEQGK